MWSQASTPINPHRAVRLEGGPPSPHSPTHASACLPVLRGAKEQSSAGGTRPHRPHHHHHRSNSGGRGAAGGWVGRWKVVDGPPLVLCPTPPPSPCLFLPCRPTTHCLPCCVSGLLLLSPPASSSLLLHPPPPGCEETLPPPSSSLLGGGAGGVTASSSYDNDDAFGDACPRCPTGPTRRYHLPPTGLC